MAVKAPALVGARHAALQACSVPALLTQAYVEKYKFTSVVAQDLLDSFLSFFPELKEQSVDCRAGEGGALCCPGCQPCLEKSPVSHVFPLASPHWPTRTPGPQP